MNSKTVWDRVRIEDICALVTSGGTPSRKAPEYYQGDIPWLKTGELNDGNLYDSQEKITGEAIKLSSAKIYPVNTVLMAMYGDGRTIGSLGITKIPAASNQACCAMKTDENICYYQFLFYSLLVHRRKIVSLALGGAQRNLNQGTIKNYEIELPPLEIQRKVASILSAYDDLIENNIQRIKILEEMALMIYREWFVNFRFPGHEQVKMVDSPLGMIPEGWEAGQLSDIASIIPGYAFKSSDWTESGVPVIKIKNIQEDGTVNADETDFVSECVITNKIEKFLLNHGDILIAMTGATAGKVGRLRSKISMGLNQRVAKIQVRKPYEAFVWHSVSNENARKLLFGLADGAAQPNMSGSQIESIKLCIPDEKILQQFNIASLPMLHETDVLYLKNQNLRQTRDLLLPKLISGEVAVVDVGINTESVQ